jgi:hypothetical protein
VMTIANTPSAKASSRPLGRKSIITSYYITVFINSPSDRDARSPCIFPFITDNGELCKECTLVPGSGGVSTAPFHLPGLHEKE